MGESPHYVVELVRDALAADPQVAALDLHARVIDDDVYLQGKVATSERQARAEQVVTSLLPGYRVHNEISVITGTETSDEEHLT